MKLGKYFFYCVACVFLFVNSNGVMAAAKKPANEITTIKYVKNQARKAGSTKSTKQTTKKSKSTKTSSTKSTQKANAVAVVPSSVSLSCDVKINPFTDNRKNQQTLGTTMSKSLQANGISEWLADASADLWSSKIKSTASAKTITLQPSLLKLYSYAQSMNIHGVIALKVDFIENGKVVDSKIYRGLGSAANVWNAEYEYYDSLSRAAHNAFPKVLQDLSQKCAP